MDAYEETKLAYEQSAESLKKYWSSRGTRLEHIELAFKLSGVSSPAVLELGCGPGRDASIIVKRSSDYLGIDYSKNLIKIARHEVPEGVFISGDMVTTPFPKARDIILAFASVIHVDEHGLKQIFKKARKALNEGGIFYISAKYGSGKTVKSDEFGTRTYYLYNQSILQKLAGEHFKVVFSDIEHIREQDWIEIAFKLV